MSAIDRLRKNIDNVQKRYSELEAKCIQLQEELDDKESKNPANPQADALRAELFQKDELIAQLRKELSEKDAEIDAIITKVESLIS